MKIAIHQKIFYPPIFLLLIIKTKRKISRFGKCFMISISVSSQSRIEKITTPNYYQQLFRELLLLRCLHCLTCLGRCCVLCFIQYRRWVGWWWLVGVERNKHKENLCPENLGATHLHQGRHPSQALRLSSPQQCGAVDHTLYITGW